MLQPIELLKKELAGLRVVANRRSFSKMKREANELIPAYENSIKFMEAVNGVDESDHQALHKHIVSKAKRAVCDYCKEPLTDEDYLNEECLKCGETVEQTDW